MKQDMILIIDLGSTENTVLAREIRDLGVYSEIAPHDITLVELRAMSNAKGIILFGGPNHIVDGQPIDVSAEIYEVGLPMMAIAHESLRCQSASGLKRYGSMEEASVALRAFVF
jgi:GMP synthase (glutamine-hydrolysing)